MSMRIMSAVVNVGQDGLRILLLICGIVTLARPASGSSLALCEGGQTCNPPKECCAQGCCYLYQPPGAPRVPMPSNDHVLSLLFLNHWYFWCFVFAVVLALLCTCSLWKKRRQLCGWDTSARHSQSEGDSAGSCYAPPQYSRCNSFHIHAPPPYTEVASKPDLYPLVFSYTDPGKGNGANYLMVQYFRNYIVQPVGSISGTSTVDSLSSSFICNANEANTLVPPPYSRAASPDLTMSFRNYLMPRSASQQVCLAAYDRTVGSVPSARRDDDSLLDQQHQQQQQQCMLSRDHHQHQQQQQREEVGNGAETPITTTTINHTSVSSNNVSLLECPSHRAVNHAELHGRLASQCTSNTSSTVEAPQGAGAPVAASTESFASLPGPSEHPASGSDGAATCDLAQLAQQAHQHLHQLQRSSGLVCKMCCSMGDIATGSGTGTQHPTRAALHKSLETCCHVNLSLTSDDSMLNADPSIRRKAVGNSCVVSSVGSNVSSLLNLDTSSSPPRATSPTAEVRELLEQIRQLHSEGSDSGSTAGETAMAAAATVAPPPPPPRQPQPSYKRPSSLIGRRSKLFSKPGSSSHHQQQQQHGSKAMYIPISFTQSCVGPTGPTTGRHLRSPASMSNAATSFLNRGRSRYCWLSKSAPTTPGAAPGSIAAGTLTGDSRPLLLTEQEEDGEQNV
uniref:WW domain binding protein VOPP1 n=1 Tax=Anopheles farauti TaxID=69004 RepID=A0A182QDY2_9DIPT